MIFLMIFVSLVAIHAIPLCLLSKWKSLKFLKHSITMSMLWELDYYLGVVANHMVAVYSWRKLSNEYGSSIYRPSALKLQVLDHFSVTSNFCCFASIPRILLNDSTNSGFSMENKKKGGSICFVKFLSKTTLDFSGESFAWVSVG
jgi:hypothetical protein